MRFNHDATRALLRETAIGAWLGFWLLGLGGRLAMRVAAIAAGQSPVLSAGTLTVLAAGVGAGVAGAALYALSRTAADRLAGGRAWVRVALFAALLALVTMRGLGGSAGPRLPFWLAVAAYGVALARTLARPHRPQHSMTREDQLRMIQTARERLLAWSRERGIPLARVEHNVPFVDDDFGLAAWLFYETDAQRAAADADGTSDAVRAQYLAILQSLGYPERWRSAVVFVFDSHEHVVRDYEGSYFYRLR